MSPLEQAWSLLKADRNQIIGGTYHTRQTMPPVVQAMVERQRERQGKAGVEAARATGNLGELFNQPEVRAELMGDARNNYDILARNRKMRGERGGRNWPTEGGPDNEPTPPQFPYSHETMVGDMYQQPPEV